MGVSFASYEIARSGLTVSERGLNVTGHNISNVNTPGYVRQQAMITTGPYQNEYTKNGQMQFGLGADIQQIRQIRHSFLDNIYRNESTTLGYWESRAKTFQDVQAILGEPINAGLQDVMNQFWDSWQELSKEPESLTVRALVRQRGESMIYQINHTGEQLGKLQDDLNSEIKVRIDEVNNITSQIANLNATIMTYEVSGDTANDYRDQRNYLIDRLSKLVDANVNEMQDGQIDVTLGGYFLVNKALSTNLYAEEAQPGGVFYVPKLEGTKMEVPIKSGIIKGLMESRGEVFGAKGSSENGTPYSKEDITFVLDISDTSAANLTKIQNNIDSYMNEINRPGVDYNLNLMVYDGTGTTVVGAYGNDIAAFKADLNNPSKVFATGNSGNDFTSVVSALDGLTYRDSANKYALLFTGESIEGNGGTIVTDSSAYSNVLNSKGIKLSVVGEKVYNENGNPTGEIGWDKITSTTGGKLYDINETDFSKLLTRIAMDNANDGTSIVSLSNNIIPDLRKQLNALVNVMVREVNFLQKSGKTLSGAPGDDFFVAIDPNLPIEAGNIKLNDNVTTGLLDLSNIVSSGTGAAGDNSIALQVANLRHGKYMSDLNGVLSIDDYYNATILSVGNGGREAESISDNQYKLVESADSYRQSIMGVSMDEEMTNMMKYKFAYDASSRAINVIDEMMETIISRMGLAGR